MYKLCVCRMRDLSRYGIRPVLKEATEESSLLCTLHTPSQSEEWNGGRQVL